MYGRRVKATGLLAFLVVLACCKATISQHVLYNMKVSRSVGACREFSPEIFFNGFALPALSSLYLGSRSFFGVLMDHVELSTKELDNDKAKNETREKLEYISKTVSTSIDSAVDRVETSWQYLISCHETEPLPWEISLKNGIIKETVDELEYSYAMIEAVIRSGTKEVVGTLEHQLISIIRKMDEDDRQLGEEVALDKIFKRMKKSLTQMKSTFARKLLEKVVGLALKRTSAGTTPPPRATFVSEAMNQVAILFHAYREKGIQHKDFWLQMSLIFQAEFKTSHINDDNEVVSKFMQDFSNEENLIEIIIQLIAKTT